MLKRVLLICLLGAAMSVYAMGRVSKGSIKALVTLDSTTLSSDSGWIYLDGNLKDYSSFALRVKVAAPTVGDTIGTTNYYDTFYSAAGGAGQIMYLVLYSNIGDTLYKIDSLATALTSFPKVYYKTISKLLGDTLVHEDLRLKWIVTDTTTIKAPVLDSLRLHPTNQISPRRSYAIKYEVISKE